MAGDIVIAIDGVVGSGKSTTARLVAEALDIAIWIRVLCIAPLLWQLDGRALSQKMNGRWPNYCPRSRSTCCPLTKGDALCSTAKM